jgi:hypothetical protein
MDQDKNSIQNFRGKNLGFFRNARKKPEPWACVLDLLLLRWLKLKIEFFHTINQLLGKIQVYRNQALVNKCYIDRPLKQNLNELDQKIHTLTLMNR